MRNEIIISYHHLSFLDVNIKQWYFSTKKQKQKQNKTKQKTKTKTKTKNKQTNTFLGLINWYITADINWY